MGNKPTIDFSFITCADLPYLDADDRLVVADLTRRGFCCQAVVWDDPAVDWSLAGVCVLRSTWDYHLKRDAFLSWAAKVSAVTELRNTLSVINWNSHKSYLRDLQMRGIPIVETFWIEKETKCDLALIMQEHAWWTVIIKPTVGLSSFGVRKFDCELRQLRLGQAHLEMLLRTGDVMIQPYFESVESYPERALIFIDGQYSHCVTKRVVLPVGTKSSTTVVSAQATDEEIAIACSIIEQLEQSPLYARVDLLRDNSGCPRLLELELIEPRLFFSSYPAAAEHFALSLASIRNKSRRVPVLALR